MKIILFFLCFCSALGMYAQDTAYLNLEEVVSLARTRSVSAHMAETERETSHWQFRSFRAGLFPHLSLSGTLPDYRRTFSPNTQDDGTILFQPVMSSNSGLHLELSQNIGFTGGALFISSRLQRFDDFERKRMHYNSNPVSIGYRQSLSGFNPFRWEKKIEPLRYEHSRRQYLSDLEAISLEAVQHYFRLLLAQMDYEMARQNLKNGEKILEIAGVRHKMGRISDNDLLQLRYSVLSAGSAMALARQEVQTAFLLLKSFLGIRAAAAQLQEPSELPLAAIEEDIALAEAKKNKEILLEFKIRRLEAEREVRKARGEGGANAELYVATGLANQAGQLDGVYQDAIDQQQFSLGFSIPLVDWGRSRALVKTAEARQELTNYQVQQAELDFEQQVISAVAQAGMLLTQLEVTEEAAEVALLRYTIAGKSFTLGEISITELNIARNEKDHARRIYLQALQHFWENYYRLRLLTLYDFEKGEPIREEK